MKIKIICIGKIKQKYIQKGIDEYSKRLKPYCRLEIIEVPDQKAPQNLSDKQVLLIKHQEAQGILRHIKQHEYLIALDINGKQFTSEKFACNLKHLVLSGKDNIVFLIGGSLGLSDDIIRISHLRLSFSKMTFPHQLMRLILLEQIYRCFKINTGKR